MCTTHAARLRSAMLISYSNSSGPCPHFTPVITTPHGLRLQSQDYVCCFVILPPETETKRVVVKEKKGTNYFFGFIRVRYAGSGEGSGIPPAHPPQLIHPGGTVPLVFLSRNAVLVFLHHQYCPSY
jgi:hypothetical protein